MHHNGKNGVYDVSVVLESIIMILEIEFAILKKEDTFLDKNLLF